MLVSQRFASLALLLTALTLDARAQSTAPCANTRKQIAEEKHYVLPAKKDTLQRGWLDPTENSNWS
jgi:hypothetical protein